jgi:hypothetical protein
MRSPRRPCWIIRVHPPLEARRMVEPPVAARSKTPVRFEPSASGMLGSLGGLVGALVANPLTAAASALFAGEIALRSTVQSAACTAGTKIGHAILRGILGGKSK